MTKTAYFDNAQKLFSDGKVTEEVFWAMVEDADVFVDEDEDDDYRLPRTYAEIEYDDWDSAEADMGARWDDMNYMRYMARQETSERK